MNEPLWTRVDAYLAALFVGNDPVLDANVEASQAGGLPAIQVSPVQGKFLQLLARIAGARSILEIGTLGGYSTTWLARALPADGRLVSLELEERHAAVARDNLERAGLADRVEIRVGTALETLPRLMAEDAGPFDLVFIDADKEPYAEYLEWSLRLSRPGTVIIADNVVLGGRVADPDTTDQRARGMRRFNDVLVREPGLEATAIQTVGVKGYDGFAIAVVGATPR